MPRLRNVGTKVVVSVSDETAALLGSEWEPVKDGSSGSAKASTSKAPAATSEAPDESWTVANLTKFAKDHGIDLGKAKKKDEILPLLAAAKTGAPSGGGDQSGDDSGEKPEES